MKSILGLIIFLSITAQAQVFIPFGFNRCILPFNTGSDAAMLDFLLGTTSNTIVTGASVVLSATKASGDYTSRIFNVTGDCLANSNWYSVSWQGSLPYGKLLPDFRTTLQSESTADYSGLSSSTFMSTMMGQWHMQETVIGTATGAKDFADSSGNAKHGLITGGVTLNQIGQIGRAVLFNGTSGYVDMGVPTNITGLGNWSVSFWINPTALTANQQIILYRSDNDSQQGFFVTLTPTGQIKLQIVNATTDTQAITSNTLTVGAWSHILITTDSSLVSANSKIYINGIQAGYTGAVAGSGAHTSAVAQNLYVGKTGTTTGPATNAFLKSMLEELTFHGRILTAAEALELYRRGINRIRFQFRSCLLSDCSDLPIWKGPDGTSATYFSEIYNNLTQLTWLSYVLPTSPEMIFGNFPASTISNNQYFQYKVRFETDNVTYLPDIKLITIKRP